MLENRRILFVKWFLLAIACAPLTSADLNIIKKADWNGREPSGELAMLTTPVEKVVIIHTAGAECSSPKSCSAQARTLQSYHMDNRHFSDVAYNFMIGNDGNVYEGRGWDSQGAFAIGHNALSLGIAFFGNFDRVLPSDVAMDAAKNLIEEGVRLGKIQTNYKLFGHRQLAATDSPGSMLYQAIKQWPHWSQNV